MDRLGLNKWLQVFLTIIAGTVVAVIAWTVLIRFIHIIVLLIASFLVAYLLVPLVNRLQRNGVPRALAALLVYLIIFAVVAAAIIFLLLPLKDQVNGVIDSLPTYFNSHGKQTGIERFLAQHGINVEQARRQLFSSLQTYSASLLNNTVTIVSGAVATITDILLVLVITFYFVLDGHAMHNRAVRLLPAQYRDRWFFFEAALNRVLGGYIRGQLVVAATVGAAAGVGCWLIGVYFPIVIGVLAFLFELIPMIGPVLGMIPAVIISLFQPHTPVVFVIIYFIVLQQIESNLIVPRVSGHAVGLHPLAALLALIAGLDLGGIGGALLSVPITGVIYVLLMALYSDATGQSHMLSVGVRPRRPTTYDFLARQIAQRRAKGGAPDDTDLPVAVANDRLASIQQESAHLRKQFEADEAKQAVAEAVAPHVAQHERQAPDDTKSPPVKV